MDAKSNRLWPLLGGMAVLALATPSKADDTLDWEAVLIDAIFSAGTTSPVATRSAAIVHVAMFDAYNGIERRYSPIHFAPGSPGSGNAAAEPQPGASRRAALIQAAYATLSNLFPTQTAKFDAQRAASLAALTDDEDGTGDGRSVALGLAWGSAVAKDILAWRATDGFSATNQQLVAEGHGPAPFTGGTATGQWRPTPPLNLPMAGLTFAFMAPFAVASDTQFRVPKPRGFDTSEWVSDYNQVRSMGAKTGSARSADQTNIAYFFNGVGYAHWSAAADGLARKHHLSGSETGRLFALLAVAQFDTLITTWSAKRSYAGDPGSLTWRPITAIRLGGTGQNPNTPQDPGWTPLIVTPNHPEYPAGHPGNNGAGAGVLAGFFGDDAGSFTLTYPSAPPPGVACQNQQCANGALPEGVPGSRTYASLAQAEKDADDARLFGGMHYPSSIVASNTEGRTIAAFVLANVARPGRGRGRGAGQGSHDHGLGDCQGDGEVANEDAGDGGSSF
jgi:hypothetical protein